MVSTLSLINLDNLTPDTDLDRSLGQSLHFEPKEGIQADPHDSSLGISKECEHFNRESSSGFSQETWGHQQGRWAAPGGMGEESQAGGQGPETQVIRTSFCLCDLSPGPCPKLSFLRLLLCVSDTVFLLLI